MLTIYGPKSEQKSGFCDRMPRRSFLQIGGLAFGGLTLPQVLQAEATAGQRSNHKAVIMIFLPGGPSHQDMWDILSLLCSIDRSTAEAEALMEAILMWRCALNTSCELSPTIDLALDAGAEFAARNGAPQWRDHARPPGCSLGRDHGKGRGCLSPRG